MKNIEPIQKAVFMVKLLGKKLLTDCVLVAASYST
jgi:hypothetical protein